MKTQLHSIEHAPVSLPYWRTLMDYLCNPPPHRVAKVQGMSKRSIQRYNATGYAPRCVCVSPCSGDQLGPQQCAQPSAQRRGRTL